MKSGLILFCLIMTGLIVMEVILVNAVSQYTSKHLHTMSEPLQRLDFRNGKQKLIHPHAGVYTVEPEAHKPSITPKRTRDQLSVEWQDYHARQEKIELP